MQRTTITFDENTPMGALPVSIVKEIVTSACSDFLDNYMERVNENNDRGKRLKGMPALCEALGCGKDKFLSEVAKGNLDGVAFQMTKGGIWYGYEKDLQRKAAELYACRRKKIRQAQQDLEEDDE
ncbi:MAG: hypothetical protein IJ759_02375 [Bacteroidales bacterium]|nr:hypothetical protein [Bacteroidales bacterium]